MKQIKVHDNIYDNGQAFTVRFLRNGVKVNKNFAYDSSIKAGKSKGSSRKIAYNLALAYRVAEWEEITHKGKSIMTTSQLTLRPLILEYLKEETPKKKGAYEEKARINQILRGIDESKKLIDRPIVKITKDDFRALSKYLATKYKSPHSTNRMIYIFSNVFKWAKNQDKYSWVENLAIGCSVKDEQERMRVPTESEIEKILTHTESPSLKIAIVIGLETGARRGELCKAVWGDISLEHTEQKHPHIIFRDLKNGEATKTVPLSKRAVQLLLTIDEEKRNGFLFPSEYSPLKSITPHSLTVAWTRAKKRAVKDDPTLADCRLHGLRGRFITDKAKIVNPLDLAMLSGHKDVNVIRKHYYQPSAEDLAEKLGWKEAKKECNQT